MGLLRAGLSASYSAHHATVCICIPTNQLTQYENTDAHTHREREREREKEREKKRERRKKERKDKKIQSGLS